MTDLELLRWLRELADADLPIGQYDACTYYGHPQRKEWACTGCDGTGESVWPRWELEFEHKPDCKWIEFKRRTEPVAP